MHLFEPPERRAESTLPTLSDNPTTRRLQRTRRWAGLLLGGLVLVAPRSAPAASDARHPAPPTTGSSSGESVRRTVRPIEALDAAARAVQAEQEGDRRESVAQWQAAAALDPEAIPPRLALARLQLLSSPAQAGAALRESAAIALRDFRASRWLVGNGLLALALAGTIAAGLLLVGILVRHLRPLHHLLTEALAWSLQARSLARWLAIGLLLLPFAAGLGVLGTLAFWVFAASFRFQRLERICALGVGAWLLMLGPALEACRPLWASDPLGRDATLVYEAQRDPTSEAQRAFLSAWQRDEPEAEAPILLRGLQHLELGQLREAEAAFRAAGAATTLPAGVVETNLGAVRALQGDEAGALRHLMRATAQDPTLFEARYDLGLVLATSGRWVEADSAFDQAAAANLDRLRALGRVAIGEGPRPPVPAVLSSSELWALDLRQTYRAAAPSLLLALLPLRSLLWSGPVFLLAVVLGWLMAPRLKRLLSVRVCFQCGRPICRRCLVRVDRHAYCSHCGETLSAAGFGESTRILIRKLLEDRPTFASRVGPILSQLLPGVGAAARGYPLPAAGSAALGGVAGALLSWRIWASPGSPLPGDTAVQGFAVGLGLLAGVLSILVNALGVRAAQHRERGLKAFFERDVDRRAA